MHIPVSPSLAAEIAGNTVLLWPTGLCLIMSLLVAAVGIVDFRRSDRAGRTRRAMSALVVGMFGAATAFEMAVFTAASFDCRSTLGVVLQERWEARMEPASVVLSGPEHMVVSPPLLGQTVTRFEADRVKLSYAEARRLDDLLQRHGVAGFSAVGLNAVAANP